MSARFEGKDAANELERAFSVKIEDFTAEQLWCLTKLCKHVRLRARSNVAFNNLMNGIFKGARFTVVQKEYNGKSYPGLKIEAKGVSHEEVEGDD